MKLKGFIPAVFTPFRKDGKINTETIPAYAAKLKNDGCIGAFIGGTTSEGLLQSVNERKAAAEAWMKESSDDFRIIIHAGANSIIDAVELAEHAAEIGAAGFSAMAPLFLKPNSVEALIGFMKRLASAAADLPFYYYHIPQVTHVDLPMIEFLENAESQIPNLVGIKYSGTDLMDNFLCAAYKEGQFNVLYGQDEKMLAALSLGMEGGIGSTYNYMTPVYTRMVSAYKAGQMEEARRLQLKSARLVRIMDQNGGGIKVGKRLMKAVGIDCGDLREPGISMTDSKWRKVEKEILALISD